MKSGLWLNEFMTSRDRKRVSESGGVSREGDTDPDGDGRRSGGDGDGRRSGSDGDGCVRGGDGDGSLSGGDGDGGAHIWI